MQHREGQDSGFTRPIIISYRPPLWLGPLNAIIYLLAIYSIMIATIHISLKLILFFISGFLLLITVKEHLEEYANKNQQSIRLDMSGQWRLIAGENAEVSIKLISVGFYSPFLLVLRFKDSDANKYSFILTSKNTDKDTLRRLRARLLNR